LDLSFTTCVKAEYYLAAGSRDEGDEDGLANMPEDVCCFGSLMGG